MKLVLGKPYDKDMSNSRAISTGIHKARREKKNITTRTTDGKIVNIIKRNEKINGIFVAKIERLNSEQINLLVNKVFNSKHPEFNEAFAR